MLSEIMQTRPMPIGGAAQTDLARERVERAVDFAAIQAVAPVGHEQVGRDRTPRPMTGAARYVLGHHAARRVMQGDQAGLSKLGALDRQHTCAQIHVRQRELARFAEAQAGDTQQAEQTVVRPGPQSPLARQRERRLEQASDLRVRVEIRACSLRAIR